MQALQGAMYEMGGLSRHVLDEHRRTARRRQDAIRAKLETASQKLTRFQGPAH
jgi:hypothetical protein